MLNDCRGRGASACVGWPDGWLAGWVHCGCKLAPMDRCTRGDWVHAAVRRSSRAVAAAAYSLRSRGKTRNFSSIDRSTKDR